MVKTNKNKFNEKYKQPLNQPNSKKDISKLTGIPMSILDDVFDRGVGAFKTNPQSVRPQVTSAEQWAMARVYASINPKSKSYKIDKSHLIKDNKKKKKIKVPKGSHMMPDGSIMKDKDMKKKY